jgi:hypothetical protein
MFLSGGQTSDCIGAGAVLGALSKAETLRADRGYDADWFRNALSDKGIEAAWYDCGEPAAPVVMQRSARLDAFTAGPWIGDHAPGSAAHSEVRMPPSVIKRMFDEGSYP